MAATSPGAAAGASCFGPGADAVPDTLRRLYDGAALLYATASFADRLGERHGHEPDRALAVAVRLAADGVAEAVGALAVELLDDDELDAVFADAPETAAFARALRAGMVALD